MPPQSLLNASSMVLHRIFLFITIALPLHYHRITIALPLHVHCTYITRTLPVKIRANFEFSPCKDNVLGIAQNKKKSRETIVLCKNFSKYLVMSKKSSNFACY